MRFDPPLVPATLVRRYKRFLADVRLQDGSELTVHCPNPGRMIGLSDPGTRCWLSDSQNPKRKLRWSLEMVESDGVQIAVHTGRTNALVEEALEAGTILECRGATWRAEVKLEDSRIDFLLEDSGGPLWVEVKQVTLADGDGARFPDAVTSRGLKHLDTLARRVEAGERAAVLFIATRPDAMWFGPADSIDPAYATRLREVADAGVEIWAYRCGISTEEWRVEHPLPLRLRS